MKKPQELHDELTKKLITENYVDLKPVNKIEATPKSDWEAKYFEFINEAGNASLNPIVNNDDKINTAEGDEKIKNVEGKYTMDTKEAGSFKVSNQVENVASHNYNYDPSVDNINNVNAQELQNGIYCEVKADPKLTLEEAQALVIKNLAKDPLFYVKNGAFGVKGLGYEEQKISENDGETYGGSGYSEKIKDTDNAMQVVKESVKDVLKEHNLGGVATSGNPNSIAKQMGDYFTQMMEEHGLNDGQVVAEENKEEDLPMDEAKAEDDVEEARQQAIEASQEAAGMDIDEKKDHDGDGDIDSDDYMAARDKAIKANMKKKVKKENIETKLAEIGKEAEMVKMEAQLDFLHEYIDEKIARVNSINEDENLKELVDKKKMKDMQKEIKLLEKRKAKMEKVYEKHCGKAYKRKEMVDELGEDQLSEQQKYDESGMVKNVQAKVASFKDVVLPQEFKDVGGKADVPLDFIGFRSNEETTKRDDGSFSVSVFAKRSDNKPLLGLDKFVINTYVTADGEVDDQTWYPNFDEFGRVSSKKTPIEPREKFIEYIKNNLKR